MWKAAQRFFKLLKPTSSPGLRTGGSPISWHSAAVGGTVVLGTLGYVKYLQIQDEKRRSIHKTLSVGQALIKCKFDLVDVDNKSHNSDDYLGKWLLIYFGFTHCPDVCPEELEKLAKVVEELDKLKVDIVPLFITVDPERDKPELLKKYLAEFSDRFIGLTGDHEQIGKTAKSFRIYYSKGPPDDDNDYIVDHTIISYLMGPKGEMVDYFGQTKTWEEIVRLIQTHKQIYKGD